MQLILCLLFSIQLRIVGDYGVERILYQMEGSYVGKDGAFELVFEPSTGNMTNRVFIPIGSVNGKVNGW